MTQMEPEFHDASPFDGGHSQGCQDLLQGWLHIVTVKVVQQWWHTVIQVRMQPQEGPAHNNLVSAPTECRQMRSQQQAVPNSMLTLYEGQPYSISIFDGG